MLSEFLTYPLNGYENAAEVVKLYIGNDIYQFPTSI